MLIGSKNWSDPIIWHRRLYDCPSLSILLPNQDEQKFSNFEQICIFFFLQNVFISIRRLIKQNQTESIVEYFKFLYCEPCKERNSWMNISSPKQKFFYRLSQKPSLYSWLKLFLSPLSPPPLKTGSVWLTWPTGLISRCDWCQVPSSPNFTFPLLLKRLPWKETCATTQNAFYF